MVGPLEPTITDADRTLRFRPRGVAGWTLLGLGAAGATISGVAGVDVRWILGSALLAAAGGILVLATRLHPRSVRKP